MPSFSIQHCGWMYDAGWSALEQRKPASGWKPFFPSKLFLIFKVWPSIYWSILYPIE
jgi:hypothetical protein